MDELEKALHRSLPPEDTLEIKKHIEDTVGVGVHPLVFDSGSGDSFSSEETEY